MGTRMAMFIRNSLYGSFIVILHLLTLVVMQETEVTSWTFNIPNVSFLSFSPIISRSQNQHISLSFRTRNPNGLLFCHYLKNLDIKELDKINYKVCAELKYGLFVLDYRLRQYQEDGLTLGIALNDDKWHTIDMFINTTSGELTLSLDDLTKVTYLKSYTRQDFTTLLDWSQQSSAIYFGGTDPDTLFADRYPHFIGCMSNIRYLNKDGGFVPVPVTMMEGVVEGCTDLCAKNNPCHHGGRCINAYVDTLCDCFGTDYQGEYCAKLGPTTVTLRGYEWVTYNMYEFDRNLLTDRIRFSLEFKTSRGSGVLFYAVGGAPYHSHVTASVHNGTVRVSMAFNDEDIDILAGTGADDYRWHLLTIIHYNRTVSVYLDDAEYHKEIKGSTYHLGLDPKVFIGGGDNFVITRGLQVTQNFVGCLKNVYVNDVSILYQMERGNPRVVYHGGISTYPSYSCEEVINIPISFPTAASMLVLGVTEDMKSDFEIEFDFKTVRSEAILFYTDVIESDTSLEYVFGYIEVWIRKGQPSLLFVPAIQYPERTQNATVPSIVNNNLWHSMQISFRNRQVKLKVDGMSISTQTYPREMEVRTSVTVGYGRYGTHKESEGYVGCIRNLKVQGEEIDALDLMEEDSKIFGLTIDGCNITNYCQGNSMCQHGGKCLSEWHGVACDCTDTHYTGRACHFSKYKKSCDEYYQSGVNTSGVMLIDLDGDGPIDPVHVQCIMGYEKDYEFFGKTIIAHNLEENTTVRGPMMRDMQKLLSYRGLDREQLKMLTGNSGWCEQYLRYDCKQSPIKLGTLTWFKAANGEMVEYLGTDNTQPGFCTCGVTSSCPVGSRCQCDDGSALVEYDEGFNRVIHQLPLIQVTIKQGPDPTSPGTGNLTLGPLVCWGNKNQLPSTAVTFGSEDSYLLSHPWMSGSLTVSFRTHHDQALLLYQTGTTQNINYLVVALTSASNVLFHFCWGKIKLDVNVVMPHPVNNGQWHQISIETDIHNIRSTVDMRDKIVEIPEGVPKLIAFTGVLYLGGTPHNLVRDDLFTDIPGLVGCMRGLVYNRKAYHLSDLIDSSINDVFKECMASCWPNPCQNGGQCVEKWGAHQCICVNKWAHSGHNCEIDINRDAVTFSGDSDSHLHFTESLPISLLDSTIIFSFRTFQQSSLLLYIHDSLNNFIQVDLIDGTKIVCKFNRFTNIFNQTKTLSKHMSDGVWKQVVVNNTDGYIKVIVDVDDDPSRNSYRKQSLTRYSQNPFSNDETVKPYRPVTQTERNVHVYVGGVPANMSSFPSLHGCIRGLKIGDRIFELQKAALQTNAVSQMCNDGCASKPCKHGGFCEELWQDEKFKCDCTFSEFAGPMCDTEASGLFLGESILRYKYSPRLEASQTTTEQLELTFQVDSGPRNKMILVFIVSESYFTHDFIIVYLDPRDGVYIQTNQGYAIHGVGKPGMYADGKPHQLLYKRSKSEMILTLDEEGIGRVAVPDNALDELDTIMIGGILNSQFATMTDTVDYLNYSNFTGCISEVTFYPNGERDFRHRPLKDLRDNLNSTGVVTTFGPKILGCDTHDKLAVTTTEKPTTWKATEAPMLTFPPWHPGPARTIYIGTPPDVPLAANTTLTTTPTTTTAMETEKIFKSSAGDNNVDDKVIAIALSLVCFLLLVAIIVAVILIRSRRRQKKQKEAEKKKQEELEMEQKQPLNDEFMVDSHQDQNHQNQNFQNQNYLARLDEFSMVSATLGARPVKNDGTSTFKPPPDEKYEYSSVPNSEEDHEPYIHPLYNRKKNRPASSISEVLEEMERQRLHKGVEDSDTLESSPNRHIPSDEEWLQQERVPLSCPKEDFRNMPIHEDFIYAMLPAHKLYPDIEEVCEEPGDSLIGIKNHEDDHDNDADNESDTPSPPPPLQCSQEYNGDSGYEAESKPDDEEEDETLMNGSYHGNSCYQGEITSNTPDSHTFNGYSDELSPHSHSPGSKNFFVDGSSPKNVSPVLSGDNVSRSSSPTTPDSNVMKYGRYGLTAATIEKRPDAVPSQVNLLISGEDET